MQYLRYEQKHCVAQCCADHPYPALDESKKRRQSW